MLTRRRLILLRDLFASSTLHCTTLHYTYTTNRSKVLREGFERGEPNLNEGTKRFFKLFEESTYEGRLTTDANITSRSGASFLARVRSLVSAFSYQIVLPDNPDRVQQHKLQHQQWRESIEEMLAERAADTGITVFM
jgi:hypothetical protein